MVNRNKSLRLGDGSVMDLFGAMALSRKQVEVKGV